MGKHLGFSAVNIPRQSN